MKILITLTIFINRLNDFLEMVGKDKVEKSRINIKIFNIKSIFKYKYIYNMKHLKLYEEFIETNISNSKNNTDFILTPELIKNYLKMKIHL